MPSPEPSPGDISPLRWPRLFQQADDPIFILNQRRRLLYVNPAWEAWAGRSLADVRGQPCRPNQSPDATAALLAALSPSPETMAGEPSRLRRRDPTMRSPWLDIFFFPWKRDGQVIAILGRVSRTEKAESTPLLPLPESILALRERHADGYRLDAWESDVPEVRLAVSQARLASQVDSPVLLQGPPGSGKEWLARAIHRLGPRRDESFARLDAERLPASHLADVLLHSAVRLRLGAVLVRHPGNLSSDLQTRLVDALAGKTLAPSLFVSIDDEAELGRLSPDLRATIGVLAIRVPGLKERRADWPRLVDDFLARIALLVERPRLILTPQADHLLRLGDWPGNLRELFEVLRDAAFRSTSEQIDDADLPLARRVQPLPPEPKVPLDEILQNTERRLIRLALEQAKNNKSKAAEILGIWRPRLLRRMEQLDIVGASSSGGEDEKTPPDSAPPAEARDEKS